MIIDVKETVRACSNWRRSWRIRLLFDSVVNQRAVEGFDTVLLQLGPRTPFSSRELGFRLLFDSVLTQPCVGDGRALIRCCVPEVQGQLSAHVI